MRFSNIVNGLQRIARSISRKHGNSAHGMSNGWICFRYEFVAIHFGGVIRMTICIAYIYTVIELRIPMFLLSCFAMHRAANSARLQSTMHLALWRMEAVRASERSHQWCTALFLPRHIAALWPTANLRCYDIPFSRAVAPILRLRNRDMCHRHDANSTAAHFEVL